MDVDVIPVRAVPSQRFKVLLASQQCEVFLYVRDGDWLFMDLKVGGETVSSGDIVLHGSPLPLRPTAGFAGKLIFQDTSGRNAPPRWEGLGTRWECLYVGAEGIAELDNWRLGEAQRVNAARSDGAL